ncbi:MAG: hypothetical protein PHW76_08415, partial [Alphaproteobacteria bacterium]|nr:hypothetical protein [Alphaproteobacteria bacterium]
NSTLDLREMWEAPFAAVVECLNKPGSKARERGALGVPTFKRLAKKSLANRITKFGFWLLCATRAATLPVGETGEAKTRVRRPRGIARSAHALGKMIGSPQIDGRAPLEGRGYGLSLPCLR